MRGFTLVEVIVVAFIVTLGVTGYVTLQSEYVRSDASLNLRSLAYRLAQEKLDDLRQFDVLETTPGELAYNDIDDNAGGSIVSGNVAVQLKTQAGTTHQFTRSWQVTDQYFVDTDADGTPDSWLNEGDPALPAGLPPYSSQKAVTVTVNYVDQQNNARAVALDGSIAPIPIGRSIHAKNESASAKVQPQVAYTPGQAPDVIAYDLGNGEQIETSKPVPEIDNKGDNNIVQFETIRYVELATQTDKLEQEDFKTVNCSCAINGLGDGQTATMTVLKDSELTVERGKTVTKVTGVPTGTQQPDICTRCCRDHHDTADTIANETYYRSENGGPHSHYKRQSDGSYTKATLVGDVYDEVCRFKRVNGYFELYPDWQLLDVVEFDDQHLFSDTNLSAYTNYSEGVIAADIMGKARPAKPAGRDMTVAPGAFQLIARGIYLDRMKAAHLAEVQAKIINGDSDWKAITPFYDINLTLLSGWSSSNTPAATVTEEPIQTILDPTNNFYGTYSRGRLEALTDGTATITVAANKYSSGITGTPAISPDEASQTVQDDTLTVTVDSKSNNEKFFGLIGDINCLITIKGVTDSCETNNSKKAKYVDLSKMTIDPAPDQFACLISAPKGKSTPFFSCENVSENWKGGITFGLVKNGYTVTFSIEYPDGTVVQTNELKLLSGLTATSNREYNLIVELTD